MFKEEYKKSIIWGVTIFLVVVASVIFFFFIFRLTEFGKLIGKIMNILQPIIYGLVIAYLLTPIANFWNRKFYQALDKKVTIEKYRKGIAKGLSVTMALLIGIAVIVGLLGLVIPKLVESIGGMIASVPGYMETIQGWIEILEDKYSDVFALPDDIYNKAITHLQQWLSTDLLPFMNILVSNLTTSVINVFNHLLNFIIGIIVSIYVLNSKERFAGQGKKILYAVFKPNIANSVITVMRQSNKIFGGFISGKLLDSLIIGILCYIGLSLLHMPYTILVSVIVGVTNVIPFFGPYIGAIPSAFLILLVNPKKCITFIIFILALQQLDGNIIGPKILGNSTGLSAFWVVFSILLGGGLFGFVGMIIGVPAFAVIYYLIKTAVESRLRKKVLPVETLIYSDINYISEEDNQIIYLEKKDEKEKSRKRRILIEKKKDKNSDV